jgi:deoxyribodipyrimidine photolyase
MSSNGNYVSSGRKPSGGISPPFHTVLLWFRRDLRVSDNPALVAAVQAATTVVSDPDCPTACCVSAGKRTAWLGQL